MKPRYFAPGRVPSLTVLALVLMLVVSAWARPKFKVLHNFPSFSGDGGGLYSPLILDNAGNLYGETAGGGMGCSDYGCGTTFELSPLGGHWEETILYNFCTEGGNKCTDGENPFGPLVFDPAGNLYGGAASGGSNGHGVIFELSPGRGGWNYNVLYETASCCLVLDTTGALYGITGPGKYNSGVVAKWSPGPDGWTYTELYSFDPYKGDGFTTENPLILDHNGNLYGTTKDGGTGGNGNVLEVSPPPVGGTGEWTEQILHYFPAFKGDGASPWAGLVFDGPGNLYGATANGGIASTWCGEGCGTVYKLTPKGHGKWKETILHRFFKFGDGLAPTGTLAVDQYGSIYGTTLGGGAGANVCAGGCGAVLKMTPTGNGKWTYTVLHRFKGPDGAGPQAGVILDSKGNIYGTTYEGGSGYTGVVFEITP